MKKLLMIMSIVLLALITVQCQPNTKTTIEVGIVNPQPDKTYRVFLQVKADSSTSRLIDGMDYLNPNVSDLIATLLNQHTVGDTLFGEVEYQDLTTQRFVNGGLVQVNNLNQKYSAMKVSYWTELDTIEPNAAGFFIRKKR